ILAAAEGRIYKNELYTEALYIDKEREIRKKNRNQEVPMSSRERQIIQLLWDEKNNKEISEIVYLSVSSVEKIKQELKDRLDSKSIAGLFRYGLLHGIISL